MESASRFLSPKLSEFDNPISLPNVRRAADRICRAIRERERIVVYGDYDVDGVTAVSLLLSFFRDMGVEAGFEVPSRFVDGYGLSMDRAKSIASGGPGLVITVDCGSSSVAEVEFLARSGMDVIVTDHHRLPASPPNPYALLNPQAWGDSVYAVMAGVGVAYLLVMAVCVCLKEHSGAGRFPVDLRRYLDIVTIGTVADMVPLVGPNRPLVVHGLKLMGSEPTRPGVVALKEVCGLGERALEAGTIAFHLGPRLNAAGRLGSAQTGIELLMSSAYSQALPLAKRLDDDNIQRRQIEAEVLEKAEAKLREISQGRPFSSIVLSSPGWHIGVLGIVASRLVERYYRPAMLLCEEDGDATGSARSIAGFNIAHALESCTGLLTRSGGHAMAAGLSLPISNVAELRRYMDERVRTTMSEEALSPSLRIDAVVRFGEVGAGTVSDVEKLAPFGIGNPEPVLASRGLAVVQKKLVGNGEHLKLLLEAEGRKLEAIGYRMGHASVSTGDVVDAAFVPEMRTWQGLTSLQLKLKDVVVHGRS